MSIQVIEKVTILSVKYNKNLFDPGDQKNYRQGDVGIFCFSKKTSQ